MAAASPVFRRFDLESHGLRWRRMPIACAHPLRDGACASLSMDLEETCASLDAFAPGDGDGWRRLYRLWDRVGDDPGRRTVRANVPAARPGRATGALRCGATCCDSCASALLPARRLGQEHFRGAGGPLLLAGNALHADLTPDQPGGGVFAMLLCGIGQQRGWPVPEGGAGSLTGGAGTALRVARRTRLETNARVVDVIVRRRRAVGVCGWPTGARSARAARSSPTSVRRSSSWTWSAPTRCPRVAASRTSSAASATTTRRSRSTGRSTARSRGRRPTRAGRDRARRRRHRRS